MTSRVFLLPVLLLLPFWVGAQRYQRIRGTVTDKESKISLPGATVSVTDIVPPPGGVSDENGVYHIDSVPVGKHTIVVSYMGYESRTIADVLVTSAKEVILPVELEEKVVKMNEVVVSQKREHINELALVSTRTFDVQETERYAGSRNDPARMASNFAGA